MRPGRRYALLAVALGAAMLAFLLGRSVLRPDGAAEQADYFCYTTRTAWACADTRPECETRLAKEPPDDILTRCKAHHEEVLTP